MNDGYILNTYAKLYRLNREELEDELSLTSIGSYVRGERKLSPTVRQKVKEGIYQKIVDSKSTTDFSEWLNTYMVVNGYQVHHVAGMTNLHISTIHNYLSGRTEPNEVAQRRFARSFSVNMLQFNFGMLGRERIRITKNDLNLIRELEDEYGSLYYTPDKDERLIKLQNKFSIMFV